MATKAGQNAKKPTYNPSADTLETLKDFGSSTVKNTVNSFKNIGTGIVDQLMGNWPDEDDDQYENPFLPKKAEPEKKPKAGQRKEFTVFNYQEYYETNIIKRQIKELTDAIRQEMQNIKKAEKALLNDVKDVENLAINSLPDKPGIYHVRFLEVVLGVLRQLRLKVGESRTWLQALVSKKKKRGSLFAARAKKSGTQYSLSQELSSARSVQ